MSDITARLDLPLIKPSQAQKHVTHNEAIQVLDGLVQAAFEKIDAVAPPFEPVEGTLFALGAGSTGEWADQGGKLALRAGGGWIFMDPQEGWHGWDKATDTFQIYRNGEWSPLSASFENLAGLGIGTTSDATNRLAVSSDASLFNNVGAGHQLKINKSNSGATASLLFQSAWTGHAEMGLAGDTGFSIKVSDDGMTWFDAIKADAGVGAVEMGFLITGVAVQQSPTDKGLDRLLKTGASATVLSGGLETRLSAAGTADAIELTTGASLPTIMDGHVIRFRANATNTGAATLNLDGLGPMACATVSGATLPAGYIRTNADTIATHEAGTWTISRVEEHGSNANGDFTRFSDGTQMIHTSVTLSYIGPTLAGAILTFPASFSDATRISTSLTIEMVSSLTVDASQLAPILCHNYHPTGCTVDASLISGASGLEAGDTITIRLFAIGRWY